MIRALLVAVSLALAGLPLQADPVPGADDARFVEARALWLAGEDRAALEALAALARADNAAAQILLAQIATQGPLHAHVTQDMPRAERIALLRRPGGLSGTSWLTAARDAAPLAQALLQSAQVQEKAPAVAWLLDHGEPAIAALTAYGALGYETAEILQVLLDRRSALPAEAARPFLGALELTNMRVAQLAWDALEGNRSFELTELAWRAPSPRDLTGNPGRGQDLARLAGQVPYWTPIHRFCSDACPASPDTCTIVGAVLLSGTGPFALSSPTQTLVPNETYWQSARVFDDMARMMQPAARFTRWYSAFDSCAVPAFAALQARAE